MMAGDAYEDIILKIYSRFRYYIMYDVQIKCNKVQYYSCEHCFQKPTPENVCYVHPRAGTYEWKMFSNRALHAATIHGRTATRDINNETLRYTLRRTRTYDKMRHILYARTRQLVRLPIPCRVYRKW